MFLPTASYKTGYARHRGESAHPSLWDGMIGAWSPGLGPVGLGAVLQDLSGYGNIGTLEASMTGADWIIAPDVRGWAIDFDDVDDQVTMTGSNSFFNMGTSPPASGVTMTAWFNITDDHASGGNLCGLGGALNSGSWFMQAITTGRVKFSNDQSTSDLLVTSATSSYSQNTWNLLSVHWDGGIAASGVTMWLNGVDITAGATTQDGGGVKTATQDFVICNGGQGDVQIAHCLVHNRKLTHQEAMELFRFPLAPFYKRGNIFMQDQPAAAGGLGIPVAMHEYRQRRQFVGI